MCRSPSFASARFWFPSLDFVPCFASRLFRQFPGRHASEVQNWILLPRADLAQFE
jgi:hypothetical protein